MHLRLRGRVGLLHTLVLAVLLVVMSLCACAAVRFCACAPVRSCAGRPVCCRRHSSVILWYVVWTVCTFFGVVARVLVRVRSFVRVPLRLYCVAHAGSCVVVVVVMHLASGVEW